MTDPHTIHPIPLTEIDPAALTRDREGLDAGALDELKASIAANGLRMPIEVFPLSDNQIASDPQYRYGLISGLRRLMAFQALHEFTKQPKYATIPAFLRPPGTMAQSLASMVEENEIRASLSPWERGRIAMLAHRQGIFGTIEEAVEKLFPAAHRNKRARLRDIAHLVEELDGHLTNPECLSQQRLQRIGAAFKAGFGNVIHTALAESSLEDADTQWRLLLPILTEAETPPPANAAKPRPGRPRRVYRPRQTLTIRREKTRDGFTLHFTGDLATSGMIDDIFDDIERQFEPE